MTKGVDFRHISVHATPEESPGFLLWRISTQWRSSIEATLKPLGLTHPQFVVLATTAWLTRNNNVVNQIDISRATGLDPNTTSQILRGLEAKDFIQRTRSLNERSKNPSLTNLGFKVLEKALPTVEKADSKFFESLAANEIGALVKIFQKITLTKTFNYE